MPIYHLSHLFKIRAVYCIACYNKWRCKFAQGSFSCSLWSFDKFLWSVESRDLSQADNSIISVSSFSSWVIGSRTLSYTWKSHLALGNLVKWMFLSILSFKNFQLSFSQFFLVRGRFERIDKIWFSESSGIRPERQKKNFYYSSLSLGKKTLF